MKENQTIAQAFGKTLREVRKEARLSQPTLAKRANLNRTYISSMERGIRQPTLTTLFKLADGLERAPDELVRRAHEIYRD